MTIQAQSRIRFLDYTFLFLGLLAIDYYVWVNTSAQLSQAYENWAFTQELEGQHTSVSGFIRDECSLLLGRRPVEKRPLETHVAAKQAAPPTPAPPAKLAPLDVVGRIEIPKLHLDLMVREGVGEKALRLAVGHVPSTALPGQAGNVALAGHRDTFFRPLRNIQKGDVITLDTLKGSYQYVVESTQIVTPNDVWVLDASSQPTLTLITCYPFYYVGSAPNRFIVRARQVGGVQPVQRPTVSD